MADRRVRAAQTSARLPARGYVSAADYSARGVAVTAARANAAARPGTCAPCLRPTTLNGSHAECDCDDRLPGPSRAVLHAAGIELAVRPWSTAVLFGADTALRRRIGELAHTVHPFAGAAADGSIPIGDGVAHLIAATGALPRATDPAAALAELRRIAAPGAALLADFPFDPGRARTEARRPFAGPGATLLPTVVQTIGWDIVATARAAGWAQASLLRIQSDELGYPAMFLLEATA